MSSQDEKFDLVEGFLNRYTGVVWSKFGYVFSLRVEDSNSRDVFVQNKFHSSMWKYIKGDGKNIIFVMNTIDDIDDVIRYYSNDPPTIFPFQSLSYSDYRVLSGKDDSITILEDGYLLSYNLGGKLPPILINMLEDGVIKAEHSRLFANYYEDTFPAIYPTSRHLLKKMNNYMNEIIGGEVEFRIDNGKIIFPSYRKYYVTEFLKNILPEKNESDFYGISNHFYSSLYSVIRENVLSELYEKLWKDHHAKNDLSIQSILEFIPVEGVASTVQNYLHLPHEEKE